MERYFLPHPPTPSSKDRKNIRKRRAGKKRTEIMHFITKSRAVQVKVDLKAVIITGTVKFRHNLELLYQLSLIAIKRSPAPKI